jgi:hypothetical protein
LIQELSSLYQSEDKQKIQQMIVDILALAIDKSPEKAKTMGIIQKALGLSTQYKTVEEVLQSQNTSKDFYTYKLIIERLNKGNLPFVNEEGIVEFPSPSSAIQNVVLSNTSLTTTNASKVNILERGSSNSFTS